MKLFFYHYLALNLNFQFLNKTGTAETFMRSWRCPSCYATSPKGPNTVSDGSDYDIMPLRRIPFPGHEASRLKTD